MKPATAKRSLIAAALAVITGGTWMMSPWSPIPQLITAKLVPAMQGSNMRVFQ